MKLLSLLQERWGLVSVREQRWLLAALALVLAALLWWLALAPALATLKAASQQQRQLDAQLQQMQRLQAQAKALQTQTRIPLDEARRLLEASVKPLGATAQMVVTANGVTLNFKSIAADALAQWLTQVRQNSHAVPVEARMVRGAAGAPGTTATWNGTLVLHLQ
jgi:general secretion pathway protein M